MHKSLPGQTFLVSVCFAAKTILVFEKIGTSWSALCANSSLRDGNGSTLESGNILLTLTIFTYFLKLLPQLSTIDMFL